MADTASRLLRLLSLLQSRADWTGTRLAERLGIGLRTLRRDIQRLRDLGYPVEATPGAAGGYRLGSGASLPPLLLDDEEAVAAAISLRTAATGSVSGVEEAALRALTKLRQVLPARLRHRVTAFEAAALPLGAVPADAVSADLLAELAAACRDRVRIRFTYRMGRAATVRAGEEATERDVEPYRLAHTARRWYLVAWDTGRADWRTFRADRIEPGPPRRGPRFTARPLPREDPAAYVTDAISAAPYPFRASVLFHAPLVEMARLTSPSAGRLEALDDATCVFHAGSTSLTEFAVHVAAKGVDFEVLDPPDLVPVLRALAARLTRAADAAPGAS
ncbi:putative DNA-binding transcriptional regulator YafY [Actinocorallia herbida]|uniref:Putative DNA-binding transcriptional regulator YafY n=1 Tax=Actinocorallia herbida TaxID=58109 RepID=A0A3N1CUR9_9ACTN|nr:WYL domain-containing protein [Actinocorallia herbida]ROO85053.1 putative DNA-binding transcriptional regulator YafY [Actinocorallia herbida]